VYHVVLTVCRRSLSFNEEYNVEYKMRKKMFLYILGVVFFIAGCATVEYSERSALMLISEKEEIVLGEEAFTQIREEARISTDGEWAEVIDRVGERIAAAADKPEYDWEFILIEDDKMVNAFALPGGKVAFYSGILPVCEDEAGIAVVMGHEVAHALARHGAERMSQGMVAGLIGSVLQAAVSNKTPEAQRSILNGYGYAATIGVMLPFSRKHESEADYIGLILMAKAGYNPEEAIRFWEKMSRLSSGQKPPEFFSTHPHDEKRIQALKDALPEAMKYYASQQ
jgi:predicted Zn-dependent protease